MQSAYVLLDSQSEHGFRLTTMVLRYPKFIHGELMTHRVLSRNASSSRAVPTIKLLEEARSDALRAKPAKWVMNEPGMQGYVEMNETQRLVAENLWRNAALEAANTAETMAQLGAHKQIVNRMLEPYTHINTIVTATEYDNFFGLRLDKTADPTMEALAKAMWFARNESVPKILKPSEWHLPYISEDDLGLIAHSTAEDWGNHDNLERHGGSGFVTEIALRVSAARCARISYTNFETGKRSTIKEDLRLYKRLLLSMPLHASPAEHQATPDAILNQWFDDSGERLDWRTPSEHGNFVGWRQYRKMIPGEAVAPLPDEFIPF